MHAFVTIAFPVRDAEEAKRVMAAIDAPSDARFTLDIVAGGAEDIEMAGVWAAKAQRRALDENAGIPCGTEG